MSKSNKPAAELTEQQVVRALEKLAAGWPKDLWLYSASGTLCLMRKVDGERVMDGEGCAASVKVWSTRKIENDGGDW